MPLACGNTVVLKGSELCPMTHRLIGEVLRDAGVPAGAINVALNTPADAKAVVDALIAHPAVCRVNFTGSTRVGRLIAETCARNLKPCLLELGGKAPFIVLDVANLDEAVKAAAFGAFFNSGADLHAHRLRYRRPKGGRRLCREIRRQGRIAQGRIARCGRLRARFDDQPRSRGSRQVADR